MRRFVRALGRTILAGFALTLCSLPAPRAEALSLQPPALAIGDGGQVAVAAEPWRFDAQGTGIVLGEGSESYGGVFGLIPAPPGLFDATGAAVEMPAALQEPPPVPDAPRVASTQLDAF